MLSKIIREVIFSIKIDAKNLRGKVCLSVFNILPDLYSFRLISNIFLSLGGCRIGLTKTYIRKKISIDKPHNVSFGDAGFINRGLLVEGSGKVKIGDRFQIGPNTHILTTNHLDHSLDQVEDVYIGNDVWVGASVIITPGTKVCDNVSIAAGAVVVSDITESGLWAGVPARKIK